MSRKTRVYLCSPYSLGDIAQNVKTAVDAADELLVQGYIPFVPHLTHFWQYLHPHNYDEWLEYDRNWLLVCDALLRLEGNSSGADREVNDAVENGIKVFEAIEDLCAVMPRQIE